MQTIEAMPRPGVKAISITDPVARLCVEIERILLDTARNKDARLRDALTALRAARRKQA